MKIFCWKPMLLLSLLACMAVRLSCLSPLQADTPLCLKMQDAVQGVLSLSSGRIVEGRIRLTSGRTLEIYDLTSSRRYQVGLDEVARIDVLRATERMERIWRFKEEGSDEKVREEVTYPLCTYRAFVTLKDGTTLNGSASAVIYVKPEKGKEERFFLLKQAKGKLDQTPDDIVYVTSIDLSEGQCPLPIAARKFLEERKSMRPAADKRVAGTKNDGGAQGSFILEGKIPGAMAVAAFDARHLTMVKTVSNRATGAYRLTGLASGEVDLIVRYSDKILVGMPGAWESGIEEKSDDFDPEAVADAVRTMNDFFDTRKIHKISRLGKNAIVLVEMERQGKITTAERKGNQGLKHLDLILFTPTSAGRWILKKKIPVFRIREGWNKRAKEMKVVLDPALSSIRIGSDGDENAEEPVDRTMKFDYRPDPPPPGTDAKAGEDREEDKENGTEHERSTK